MFRDEVRSQDGLTKKCSYQCSHLSVSCLSAPVLVLLQAGVKATRVLASFILYALACTPACISSANADERAKASLFLIQIKNLSDYQGDSWTFGEGVWVLHDQEHPLFKHGEPLYQNGMHTLLKHSSGLEMVRKMAMHQGIAAGAAFSKKTIEAGEKISFAISVRPGQRFSFVINLHESNDKFLAPKGKGIKLFDLFSQPIVRRDFTGHTYIWDGGSSLDEDPKRENIVKTSSPDPNDRVRLVPTGRQVAGDGFRYPPVEDILKVYIKSLGAR